MTGRSKQESSHRQESYEMFPSWPEGQPVPQYLTPQQAKPGTFHQVLDHIRQKLGLKAPPPPPSLTDQRVMQIADRVRSQVANIYDTSFSSYHVVSYTTTSASEYGQGTLYTMQIHIAPPVQDHQVLQLKVFNSVTGDDLLVHHSLQ